VERAWIYALGSKHMMDRLQTLLPKITCATTPRLLNIVYLVNDILCACKRRRGDTAEWSTDPVCVAVRRHLGRACYTCGASPLARSCSVLLLLARSCSAAFLLVHS
jgi:hypothetical protein